MGSLPEYDQLPNPERDRPELFTDYAQAEFYAEMRNTFQAE